jgi:hypothetical protein
MARTKASGPTPDESQRTAAIVAGFAILLGIAIVVVANYGVDFRLLVANDAAHTARNIMAHETLFRVNIACNLIYVMTQVALISALYVILKPLNRTLASVAAISRLIFALMWGVSALNSLGALRLLSDAAYLPVFRADQLQTLARLHVSASFDDYYVGLPFWALASTICAYLWWRSRYIPRALAAFGMVASAWGVICAFAFIVFPDFDRAINAYWFDVPMTLFELALALWLLVKGLRSQAQSPVPEL